MTQLRHYHNDGANQQARAVLCFIEPEMDCSWDDAQKRCLADITIARWENCREQGYVLSLRSKGGNRQLNIAFFEHRNSDNICAVEWEQTTINAPTIDTAQFGEIYKNKYDVSHSTGYGKVREMAEWINKRLEVFWMEAGQ
jgi:hypothetical protein